jgi:hypothetical protein
MVNAHLLAEFSKAACSEVINGEENNILSRIL